MDEKQSAKEIPVISSTLRWDQVRLPSSTSEAELDLLIFLFVKPQWLKMARVLFDVMENSKLGAEVTDEIFAARIQALAEAGRLEKQGDLRKWRHSEVRLPQAQT